MPDFSNGNIRLHPTVRQWKATVELNQPIRTMQLYGKLANYDNQADEFCVKVLRDGEAVTSIFDAKAYFTRADGVTVPMQTKVDGNIIYAIGGLQCYLVEGPCTVVIKITDHAGLVQTMQVFTGEVMRVVDPDLWKKATLQTSVTTMGIAYTIDAMVTAEKYMLYEVIAGERILLGTDTNPNSSAVRYLRPTSYGLHTYAIQPILGDVAGDITETTVDYQPVVTDMTTEGITTYMDEMYLQGDDELWGRTTEGAEGYQICTDIKLGSTMCKKVEIILGGIDWIRDANCRVATMRGTRIQDTFPLNAPSTAADYGMEIAIDMDGTVHITYDVQAATLPVTAIGVCGYYADGGRETIVRKQYQI